MNYLNLDLNYFDHRKTKRLIGLLGKGAEVLPIKLWCYCGKHHAESGKLTGYSAQEIESIVEWWGKDGQCIEAMIKVGCLIKMEDGFEVKDWLEHSGHLGMFKKRAKDAANKRWSSNATSNAKDEVKQCPNQLTNQPPNQLTKDQAKKRPEYSETFVLKAECVKRKGINIYELLGRFYKQSKLSEPLPEAVLNDVLDEFLIREEKVKDLFPYFLTVLKNKSGLYFANKNSEEGRLLKQEPLVMKDIMSQLGIK